jgi:hypothetical protein
MVWHLRERRLIVLPNVPHHALGASVGLKPL